MDRLTEKDNMDSIRKVTIHDEIGRIKRRMAGMAKRLAELEYELAMAEADDWNLQDEPKRTVRSQQANCNCGSGLTSHILNDARGIYCGRVCPVCEAKIKASFRPEIFSDPNYYTDEPVEED